MSKVDCVISERLAGRGSRLRACSDKEAAARVENREPSASWHDHPVVAPRCEMGSLLYSVSDVLTALDVDTPHVRIEVFKRTSQLRDQLLRWSELLELPRSPASRREQVQAMGREAASAVTASGYIVVRRTNVQLYCSGRRFSASFLLMTLTFTWTK